MTASTPTNEQIAAAFSAELRLQLNAGEFVEMLARNAAETDPAICHSHDFCDANQVMIDALAKLGIEWDVDVDTDTPWALAKKCGFAC